MFNLEGKVCIITGASNGLGFSLANAFKRFKADVVGLSRSIPRVGEENSSHIRFMCCDVSSRSSVEESIDRILSLHGRIDVLVNCAGITLPVVDRCDVHKDIEATMNVNFYGTVNCCEAILPIMTSGKGGSIINITSIGAMLGFPGNPGYQSSKAAIEAYTRSIAFDFGLNAVRANNIVPGYFKTQMTAASWKNEELSTLRAERTLLKRWGEPEEIIGPCVFLASDLSSYVTGISLPVDGGWLAKGL